VLERPPKDDLRVQRWLRRFLVRAVLIVGAGAFALWLHTIFTGQPAPRSAAGWIIGGTALMVFDGLFARMMDRARKEAEEEGPPFTMLGVRREKRR
jgi:hypothetical protein